MRKAIECFVNRETLEEYQELRRRAEKHRQDMQELNNNADEILDAVTKIDSEEDPTSMQREDAYERAYIHAVQTGDFDYAESVSIFAQDDVQRRNAQNGRKWADRGRLAKQCAGREPIR